MQEIPPGLSPAAAITSIEIPDETSITDTAFGEFANACHVAALRHQIYEALSESPCSSTELARRKKLHSKSLDHVLRVLVARGDLLRDADEIYRTTPKAKAFWVRSSILYRGPKSPDELPKSRAGDMVQQTLQEGLSPIGHAGRTYTEMWEQGDISEQAAARFNGMMHSNIFASAIAAVRSGAFTEVQKLVDVGGGPGSFAIAFAAHQTDATAVVMDLDTVCLDSKKYVEKFCVQDRVHHFPGNFFKGPWPEDADAMLLSNILHDWPIERGTKILNGVLGALPSGGRVFIHECLLDESRTSPLSTVVFDFLMHKNHGSQQYTKSQMFDQLEKVGFSSPRVVHEYSYYSLIEATKT